MLQKLYTQGQCRKLFLDIHDDNSFALLEIMDQKYLIHARRPPRVRIKDFMHHIARYLFPNPGSVTESDLAAPASWDLHAPDAKMDIDWKYPHFRVWDQNWVPASHYAWAAASLRAPTEHICDVCLEPKRVFEMSQGPMTARCRHQSNACRDCIRDKIHHDIDHAFNRIECALCQEPLQYADIKRLAAKPEFERYDRLMARAVLNADPDFRWCLAVGCGSGQSYDPEGCAELDHMECVACKAISCRRHNKVHLPGQTCAPFVEQHESESKEMVEKTSKACPSCGSRVHKYEGCNHITCMLFSPKPLSLLRFTG